MTSEPRNILLKNAQSPGDIVMLTAAVRDLHRSYPGQFRTGIQTTGSEIWDHNPLITHFTEEDGPVEVIDCLYPLIHRSNTSPYHFLFGFIDFLNQALDLNIKPTDFKGDIYLAPEEKNWISQVHEITGWDTPFWIIDAGGKYDFTAKWWDPQRYQEVVDHFAGRIQFVQIGQPWHYHPELKGVLNLIGKTDLRQFIRLMYHAQGVLTPVSFPMHLAAAVETKPGNPRNRACVVVAGGREPMQWEAYPHHQYIHTNGALFCCDNGGCWKSRVVPLGDGDEKDNPENLCVNVVDNKLPRCLDMITAEEVIRRIELYYEGGALNYLAQPVELNMERI